MISRFTLALLLTVSSATSQENYHWADVVVYGDSPSAVSAAIELAGSKHDVLLVSPVPHVGGMMVEGLGSQDVDARSGSGAPIGGLTAEFYLRVAREYSPGTDTPRYRFEAKVAEKVIDAWLEEKSVRQLRGRRLSEAEGAVKKADGRITGLLLEDGTRIGGRVFIDGTVEGDLMASAGVTYAWGREGNAAYGENVAGVINPSSKDQYDVDVDPYVVPGDLASGVITGVQDEEVGVHGSADSSAMGFCLRLPLTKNPANKIPITAPPGYQVSDYELYKRFLAAGGINDWLDGPGSINSSTTTKLFDLGSWHNLSGNLYGRNHQYPTGSHALRETIYLEHKHFTQGLIYYLSTDPSVPAPIRNEWSRWGLPADEFTDNGGWPRRLYVRCGRRMISDYVITEADVRRDPVGTVIPRPPVEDPIALAYWPVDLHSARTVIRDGKVYNEGAYFDLGNYRPFGIPYRSIIPKRAECTNLLVPSALSSSYAGYGAVRLEWTFMVLGQSAATAAALALDQDIAVQDVPYPQLRTLMLAREQRLSLGETGGETGIIIDNSDPTGVAITGNWTASTHFPGHEGPDYLHDGNDGKGTKSIRFTPDLPDSGEYAVYARWNSDPARANNVPCQISHAGGLADLTINQQENGNMWSLLGKWSFEAGSEGGVLIGTTGTAGFVIADAVKFVSTAAPVTVSIVTSQGIAPEDGSRPGRFVIRREGDTGQPLTVNLEIGGTATAGADYANLPASVTIPAGSAWTSLDLLPLPDDLAEGTESVLVTLAAGDGYTPAGSASATVSILDPPYHRWQSRRFTPEELNTPGVTGPGDDPNGDGASNMLEFILGGDSADLARMMTPQILPLPENHHFDLTFWRRREIGSFSLGIETSPDLNVWTDRTLPGEVVDHDAAGENLRVRYRMPIDVDSPRLFVRLAARET